MKEQFIEKNFRKQSLDLINKINGIIKTYKAQGYELTLRQVYYQLVSRAWIENNERSYKNIGSLVNDGRLAGLIDWDAIVDRTRHIRIRPHWDSPEQILKAVIQQYHKDLRETQGYYVEVWVEKDALIDIVEGVAEKLDVPAFSCRGYVSQSEMYEASKRFINAVDRYGKKQCYLLHLGDHDPSGKDMTRDIEDRLKMFGAEVEVRRLALNWDQIELYNPPTNPAKLTDSRADSYIEEFGDYSWELDALEPKVIEQLIIDAVADLTDQENIELVKKEIEKDKKKLSKIMENYDSIDFEDEE